MLRYLHPQNDEWHDSENQAPAVDVILLHVFLLEKMMDKDLPIAEFFSETTTKTKPKSHEIMMESFDRQLGRRPAPHEKRRCFGLNQVLMDPFGLEMDLYESKLV